MKQIAGIVAVSVALVFARPARAAAPEDAVRHFAAGREHYKNRDYAKALTELEASLAVYASPNTRLYLARTLRELDRLTEAASAYELTIDEARRLGTTDPEYVKSGEAATAELTDVERKIAWIMLRFTSERAPAAPVHVRSSSGLELDLPLAGGRVALRPGTTTLSARSADGQHDGPRAITVVAGERSELAFRLAPDAPPARAATGPSPWIYAGFGLGAALAATSIATWLVADGDYGYLEDHCATRFAGACADRKSQGQTFEVVAVTTGIAAVVVVAATAVAFLTTRERH